MVADLLIMVCYRTTLSASAIRSDIGKQDEMHHIAVVIQTRTVMLCAIGSVMDGDLIGRYCSGQLA